MKGILTVIGARLFCISEIHSDNVFWLLFCHVEIVVQAHGILLLFFGSQFGINVHDHRSVRMSHPCLQRFDWDSGFICLSAKVDSEVMAHQMDSLHMNNPPLIQSFEKLQDY